MKKLDFKKYADFSELSKQEQAQVTGGIMVVKVMGERIDPSGATYRDTVAYDSETGETYWENCDMLWCNDDSSDPCNGGIGGIVFNPVDHSPIELASVSVVYDSAFVNA